MKSFEAYDWPGNIRELSNTLERTLYSMEGFEDTIRFEHLPPILQTLQSPSVQDSDKRMKDIRDAAEREALLKALRASNNNIGKAAEILGMHRTALYKKIKKFNIPQPEA
jgi:transcriptional regulator with PAS, ATPase and Fis domain